MEDKSMLRACEGTGNVWGEESEREREREKGEGRGRIEERE